MVNPPTQPVADDALPGVVGDPTISDLPSGYIYGVTRYADIILAHAFPTVFGEIKRSLEAFRIDFANEIATGGGGRAKHTARFDQSLYDQGWQKHNVLIEKRIDDTPIFKSPTHEIDVFKLGEDNWYPGIAVEMEWNNKDPFYHRDLNNFSGLFNEGVIAVGVIVTRGPRLQKALEFCGAHGHYPPSKYGTSTTHWDKLLPMVNLGAGGQCPLFLVGIEPARVDGWPEETPLP
ncbi:MAG: BglII/BstYI family type II restriction endonuclease [Bowdeniella nasicola]|nr:BglII/BstYI family type II restriction endonuclease [Bowdeniella nasicola]